MSDVCESGGVCCVSEWCNVVYMVRVWVCVCNMCA